MRFRVVRVAESIKNKKSGEEKANAYQIADGRQIRDRVVVRILAKLPNQNDEPVAEQEEYQDLCQSEQEIQDDQPSGQREFILGLEEIDDHEENKMTGHCQGDEDQSCL